MSGPVESETEGPVPAIDGRDLSDFEVVEVHHLGLGPREVGVLVEHENLTWLKVIVPYI